MRSLFCLALACCTGLPSAAFATEPPKPDMSTVTNRAAERPQTPEEIARDAKLKANLKAATDAALAEFGVKTGAMQNAKSKSGPTPPTPPKAPVKPVVTLAPAGG